MGGNIIGQLPENTVAKIIKAKEILNFLGHVHPPKFSFNKCRMAVECKLF